MDDQELSNHGVRTAEKFALIWEELVQEKPTPEMLEGARLHDVGKMTVSTQICTKPGKLTRNEWKEMQDHPAMGSAMMTEVGGVVGKMIVEHHEHWDGTGYPVGLKGEEICLPARVLALADSWDAMSFDRIYRKALKSEEIIKKISDSSGKLFDPNVVAAFRRVYHVIST